MIYFIKNDFQNIKNILLNLFFQTTKWLANLNCRLLSYRFKKELCNKFFWGNFFEWGSTARNLIAQQSIGWHFWQEINCKTQNLSTAQIHLILAQLDSKSWQKSDKWTTLSSSWHFFLVQHINWKSQFLTIEMVNNFICRTCSWPKLPYLT
jgi:hypothetical protein